MVVFCLNDEEWFKEAKKDGCICLSFNDFRGKLKLYLDSHLELSFIIEKFEGWQMIKLLSEFPNKEIYINDDYIIIDRTGQKISDNLIPLFQNILPKDLKLQSLIFTKDFNVNPDNSEKRKEKAKKVYKKLKGATSPNYEFIIYSKKDLTSPDAVLHGRRVVSNYFKIYSPKGLNLIPFKKNNEDFTVKTIFDKRTYMSLNAELKVYRDWLHDINTLESRGFKFYPTISSKY